MCRIDVFIGAVTLWLTAFASSLTPEIVQYSEEESSIVPIVQSGEYGTLYNKVVTSAVEYIFVFNKTEVSHSSDHTKDRLGIYLVSVEYFI